MSLNDSATVDSVSRTMRDVRPGVLKNPLQRWYLWHLQGIIRQVRAPAGD